MIMYTLKVIAPSSASPPPIISLLLVTAACPASGNASSTLPIRVITTPVTSAQFSRAFSTKTSSRPTQMGDVVTSTPLTSTDEY